MFKKREKGLKALHYVTKSTVISNNHVMKISQIDLSYPKKIKYSFSPVICNEMSQTNLDHNKKKPKTNPKTNNKKPPTTKPNLIFRALLIFIIM